MMMLFVAVQHAASWRQATDVGEVPRIVSVPVMAVGAPDAVVPAAGRGRLAERYPRSRQALGVRARQRIVERFSPSAMSPRYADLDASSIRQTLDHRD